MSLMQLGPQGIRVDRRTIRNVNLAITTRCDRSCPWCAYGIAHIAQEMRRDFAPAYIEAAGRSMRGIDRVNLTGGEPTLHAEFDLIAARARGWFGCRVLTVETNGAGAREHADAFRDHFDRVSVTHYTADSFPGSADNSDTVSFLVAYARAHAMPPGWLSVWRDARHERFDDRRGAWPCARKAETVSFWDGQLYPCCAAPGSLTARGIILTTTWRTDILDVPLPCEGCVFGEAKEHKSCAPSST